jgi:hypothetical protein
MFTQASSGFSYNIISFDTSLLTGWYQVQQTNAGLAAFRAANGGNNPVLKNGAVEDILPPWDYRIDQPDFNERLSKALKASSIFDANDKFFDQEMPEDQEDLFRAYKALARLQTLADFASRDTTNNWRLPGLESRFQSGLSEFNTYVAALDVESFMLSTTAIESKVDTSFSIARASSVSQGQIVQIGAYNDALQNVVGDEVFTISADKFGVITDVVIDLANVTGTLNLDNIADYINQELSNAGIVTTVKRDRIYDEAAFEAAKDPDDPQPLPSTFGFVIEGVSTEKLSFSAAVSQPAVYVAGSIGSGDDQMGQILKFTDLMSGAPVNAGGDRIKPTGGEDVTANAIASAMDSKGQIYVLGNTTGDLGNFNNNGDQDVFIRKYDSTGNMLWEQLLGATQTAEGFGLAVDNDDNVVIVGTVKGDLISTAIGGNFDSFVTKFGGDGQEIFTRQLSPAADDGANSVAIAADGSIFVTGYTKAAMSSDEIYGGARDGYVTKLDSAGALTYNRQFGGATSEEGKSIAVNAAGDIFVASLQDGNAVVTKYSGADDTSAASWEINLGSMGSGQIGNIIVDGSDVYLGGSTDDPGFGSSVLNAHSGDMQDGFLVKMSDNGTSGSVGYTTFVSGGSNDMINDITVSGGSVYVAGETRGDLGGGFTGTVNGFVAQFDAAGAEAWNYQYSGYGGVASAQSLVVDQSGSSVLDALGFATGEVTSAHARTVVANSSVRADQNFYISVDGSAAKKIVIDDNDTLRALSLKINAVLGFDGKASVRRTSEGDVLRIEVNSGIRVDFTPGKEGEDALAGLGITVGTLYNDGSLLDDDGGDSSEDDFEIVSLGLEAGLNLSSKVDAEFALELINDAMTEMRDLYRNLTMDPSLKALLDGKAGGGGGPVPSYLSAQLANYQAGLARLSGGGGSSFGLF